MAKQYARKALPGTLSLCFSICEAEKNWDAIAELGKQYPENVQGEITMLRSYALALQNSGKNEELLALAAANPVVLHQKTLYPALGELAKNYSDTKPEEAALIAEAAVHVNAYPDREVRTPFERLLLGDYDENALRPYRGANCVEMLCKQGYTAEQAAKIADRMPRINADTYELERGARLAVAQENIHYLSEYYLWEELLTSPDKAVGRLALHMQGNTGTDANGQPIGKRDAEYIQLYRVCIAPNRKTYDSNLRYTQLYLGALLRSGQNEEALAVADTCWTACTDAGLLTKIIEIAEQTDKNRYETLIQHCSSQMKKRRANEFEQMLLSMDRRMMDYVSRPEQLEQMGYDKATVQMICTNLPKVNNYPSGNAPVQQYERVYYVQGNANGQAERCLRKAIQKETNESRKKQLTAVLFAMLCKEQRLAEAAEHLPTDEEMMAQMHSTTSLWYFRTLYAIKDYTRYCKLYDACRTLPTAVICNPKNMGLRDVCETLRARIYTGHEIDNFSALWAGAINPFVLSKAPNREQLKETLAALNTQAYLPQLAYALGVLAEECYRMNPNHLRDVAEVLLPQGAKAIPETLVTALPRAAENGQQALDMLILLELAQADYAACARAVTWFRGMLRDAFLSGTAEPICDTIGVWVGQLVPMLQRCELPAAATQLSYIGWLYVIQRLHGGHTPDAAVDWLFGEDVLIPMPKNFPEKEKDALTNWAMKDYPEKCALLLNKYPELSKYGLKAASSPLPEQEEAAAIPAQAALWEQYAINLYYIYRDYYNKSDDESYRDSRLDEIGRLSVSCHIQRNLPDALYTDEQWGCISDFGCMPTELVALSRAEKPDTPYISHTSSLVMQMIQKTSLEELKQMGHTYLNYVRRNSSKNPLEDWKQAVNYYYAGAAQGDAECAAAVGYCCEMDPRGSNLPLALAWYQHAAKAGSAWAMEKVATFYEEGYGCTANRALADACRETLKYMR